MEVVHMIILYRNHTVGNKVFEAIRVSPSQLPAVENYHLQELQQSF